MVERGVRRPTIDSAKRIAGALELPLSEIIQVMSVNFCKLVAH